MKKYGVSSCKPTIFWSNSWKIRDLDLGPLTASEKATSISLAHSYRDKNGVKRCTGKKTILKESQTLVLIRFQDSWSGYHRYTCLSYGHTNSECISLLCIFSFSCLIEDVFQSFWLQNCIFASWSSERRLGATESSRNFPCILPICMNHV